MHCLQSQRILLGLLLIFICRALVVDATISESNGTASADFNSVNPPGENESAVRFEIPPFYRNETISHYCTSVDLAQIGGEKIWYIRNGVLTDIQPSVSRVVVYGFDSLCDDMFANTPSGDGQIGVADSYRNDSKVHGETLVRTKFSTCGKPHQCAAANAQVLYVWSVGKDTEKLSEFGIPPVKAGWQVDTRSFANATKLANRRRKRGLDSSSNVSVTQDRIRFLFVVVDFRSKSAPEIQSNTKLEFGMTLWFFTERPQERVGVSSFQLPPTLTELPEKMMTHSVDIACMYSVPRSSESSMAYRFGLQPLAVRAHTHQRGRAAFVVHLDSETEKPRFNEGMEDKSKNLSSVIPGVQSGNQVPLANPGDVLKPYPGGSSSGSKPAQLKWKLLAAINTRSPQVFFDIEEDAKSVIIRDGDYLLIRCVFDTSNDVASVPILHNVTFDGEDSGFEVCNVHLRFSTAGELPPKSVGTGSFMQCFPNKYKWLSAAFDADVNQAQLYKNKLLDIEIKSGGDARVVDLATYSFMLASDYSLLRDSQSEIMATEKSLDRNVPSRGMPTPKLFDPDSLAATTRPATQEELSQLGTAATAVRLLPADDQIVERKSYAVLFDLAQTWSVATDARDAIHVVFAPSTKLRSIDRFDDKNVYTEKINGPVEQAAVIGLSLVDGLPSEKSSAASTPGQSQSSKTGGQVDMSLISNSIDKLPDGTVGHVTISYSHGVGEAYFAYRVRWFADLNAPCALRITDLGVHQVLEFDIRSVRQSQKPRGALPPLPGPGNRNDTSRFCKPTDVLFQPNRNQAYVADGLCDSRIVVMNANTGSFDKIIQYNWRPSALAEGPNDTVCIGDYDSLTIRCLYDPPANNLMTRPSAKLVYTIKASTDNEDVSKDLVSSYRVKTFAYATNRKVFYVAAQQRFGANVSMLVIRFPDGLLLGRFDNDAPANALDFALTRDETKLVLVNAALKTVSVVKVDAPARVLPEFKMNCTSQPRVDPALNRNLVKSLKTAPAVESQQDAGFFTVAIITLSCVGLAVGLVVYCLKRPKSYLIFNRSRFVITWRNVMKDLCYCFTSDRKQQQYSAVARDRSSSDPVVESALLESSSDPSDTPSCSYSRSEDTSPRSNGSPTSAKVGFAFGVQSRARDRIALLDSDDE